jgi:hypothetical protein
MSRARDISKLITNTGDVKLEHLDKVPDNKDIRALKTKLNLNLGITEYTEKK